MPSAQEAIDPDCSPTLSLHQRIAVTRPPRCRLNVGFLSTATVEHCFAGVMGQKRQQPDTDHQTPCVFEAHQVGSRRRDNRCGASRRWRISRFRRPLSSLPRRPAASRRIVHFDPEPTKCTRSTPALHKCRACGRYRCAPQHARPDGYLRSMAAYSSGPFPFSSTRRAKNRPSENAITRLTQCCSPEPYE